MLEVYGSGGQLWDFDLLSGQKDGMDKENESQSLGPWLDFSVAVFLKLGSS